MTGRERITNILRGKPVDRVPWTTIADTVTRQEMPPAYRDTDALTFYRNIGCDILQFGKYGMPAGAEPIYPFQIVSEVEESEEAFPAGTVCARRALRGRSLEAWIQHGHPVKHPVESVEDLALLLDIVEAGRMREIDRGCEESYRKCEEAIGDDGVFAPTLDPSPVQQLIEFECGPKAFYYLYADAPELMERVISSMFELRKQEYEWMAAKTPFELIIPVENTSTALISPALYRKFSLPHMRAYADAMHRAGKKAVIHMCGHLKHLLPELKEMGLDGIHALTPPPIGDLTFDAALDALGDQLIIIGVLDGSQFHDSEATPADIRTLVRRTLTERLRASNFVLWPGVDGLPTETWRLEAVRDAVEQYGRRG